MIDRLAPSQRPPGANSGTQRWESLLFCHWEIDPAQLRPHLPAAMELDTYDGRAFVGIVPFKMRHIRPSWLPHRFAFNFLETNVRTYVVHNDRPGVYFFSLDASSRLAVMAARIGWSLPYHFARMSSEQCGDEQIYQSVRRGGHAKHRVAFRVTDHLGPSVPDSLEHFLFERYLLFVEKNRHVYCGQVHHDPYDVWSAEVTEIDDQLVTAAGLPNPQQQPALAHFSPGVDVEVFAIAR
ncbi:hypothetical protein Mal15_59580 [Stieleria maiorica]|uniref:DUF2071 domain-containing protein n=1 Tax=Stieleria maiorica TaxID=2795974 RepID=A0A5B9MPG2_9BACT|nr:DUF2071 domain-containing protein [Stieleria maiorica]QEG01877.1 hypothetical protein Mal15_59580 [Stieleria maiorica]